MLYIVCLKVSDNQSELAVSQLSVCISIINKAESFATLL